MKDTIGRLFLRRLIATAGAAAATLTLVGGAYALSGGASTAPAEAVTTSASPSVEPKEAEEQEVEPAEGEEQGVHGGTKPRLHEGCGDVTGLEGNWTHGDYVSAIAKNGDSDATRAAAKTDCGKHIKGDHGGANSESAAKAKSGRGHGKGKSQQRSK